jgi:hypothetical protein
MSTASSRRSDTRGLIDIREGRKGATEGRKGLIKRGRRGYLGLGIGGAGQGPASSEAVVLEGR